MARVACLQVSSPPGETTADRVNRVVAAVESAVADHDLVVLPELWASGYFAFDRYERDAEPVDGPTVARLRAVARRGSATLVAGSFVERGPDGLANSAVTIDPSGEVVHTYRKVHLFGYDSEEARLLAAGAKVSVATTPIGRLGPSTCYDLRFPELYRALVDEGAELVVVVAAWPAARLAHWRLLAQARAVENQVVVVACNAVGTQGATVLGGHSMVVDPWGEILAEGDDGEGLVTAEVDLGRVREVRAEFPVLEHRRFDRPAMLSRDH